MNSFFRLDTMAQSYLLSKEGVETFLAAVTMKLKIKVPQFDNSVLVQGYPKTLIGRCMNMRDQSMKNLLFSFLVSRISKTGLQERIWD